MKRITMSAVKSICKVGTGLAKIVGNEAWYKLKNKQVLNRRVLIENCGDIHPFQEDMLFPHTKELFLVNNNKNFIYYWLNWARFPSIRNIYLDSHPCEYTVPQRFGPQQAQRWKQTYPKIFPEQPKVPKVYLSERFRDYKERWAKDLENIQVFPNFAGINTMNFYLNQQAAEELQIIDTEMV